jgi:hypothetical protein
MVFEFYFRHGSDFPAPAGHVLKRAFSFLMPLVLPGVALHCRRIEIELWGIANQLSGAMGRFRDSF